MVTKPGSQVSASLRVGERSATDAPAPSVTGQSARPNASARRNRTLPGVNLTEHIESTSSGRDPVFQSPRECDCPEWVIRCTHWHDDGVVLVTQHGTSHDYHNQAALFSVYRMSSWEPCRTCGDMCSDGEQFHGEADALAAFYAAEAELLALPSDAPVDGEELWDAWLHARSVSR